MRARLMIALVSMILSCGMVSFAQLSDNPTTRTQGLVASRSWVEAQNYLTNNATGINFGSLTVGGNAVLTNEALFLASAAYGITSGDTNNWRTAYGWGNHAIAGYLTNNATGVNFGSLTVGGNSVLTNTPTLQQVVNAGNGATNVGSLADITDMSGSGRAVFGTGLNLTDITATSVGASQHGVNDGGGTQTIGNNSYGASQRGYNFGGTQTIANASYGSSQHGVNWGGIRIISQGTYGASQHGHNEYAQQTIGESAHGASQRGYAGAGSTATNDGVGAMQLYELTAGQNALTTVGGAGSLLLGAGVASNRNAIVAGDGQESHGDGSITAVGGFFGSLTVGGNSVLTNEALWIVASNNVAYLNRDNTYGAATIQSFALATVTNNASASTDIVNWRTMTNWVVSQGFTTNTNTGTNTFGTIRATNIIQTAGGWDDLVNPANSLGIFSAADITAVPASNALSFATTCTTNLSNGDNAWLTIQMPHCWRTNTDVHPHIHFVQESSTHTNMWFLRYKWYNIGDAVPTTWTELEAGSNKVAYTSGSRHQIFEFDPDMIGTGKDFSSLLEVKIYRKGTVGTGAVMFKQFDVHYQKDSLGSDSEYGKSF